MTLTLVARDWNILSCGPFYPSWSFAWLKPQRHLNSFMITLTAYQKPPQHVRIESMTLVLGRKRTHTLRGSEEDGSFFLLSLKKDATRSGVRSG